MKRIAVFAVILGLGVSAGTAAVAGSLPAPTAAQNEPLFASAEWDDDDRHVSRSATPMPVPNAQAIRQAGIVRVTEVERDDGLIEVEGYDRNGREIDLVMDRDGKRVLSSEVDRDDD